MQYKIPVQIENEDPIFLGLWLRQLMILMIWWGIWFTLFDNLKDSMGNEIALIPALFIFWIAVLIAVFKHSEMTFIPFFLSLLRLNINPKERNWDRWVDSFQPIDIWYVVTDGAKKKDNVDFDSKLDKLKNLDDQINKI